MNITLMLKWVTMVLLLIGALNWGLIGAFQLNVVTTVLGDATVGTRIVYILVGLAGLYQGYLIFIKKML